MEKLISRLSGTHRLPDRLIEMLHDRVKRKTIEKDEFLLREGQICRMIFFIEKGFVVQNTPTKKGFFAAWLLMEEDIGTSIDSLFKQEPSTENIQAKERTIILYITYEDWVEICREFPDFGELTRKILHEYYGRLTEHVYKIGSLDPDELYLDVLANNPE